LLTGGGSQIAGIVDTLHTELELPVAIAALPDVLELPPELRDASYSYNTAIGLGMRRFFPL
jgi:cell division ATPase FtsA